MSNTRAEIRIGTSGYSYEDWVGPFYPESLPRTRRLEYYSHYFSFTEINFSYYRMPSPRQLGGMVERVPDSFRFSIKAHGSLTHEVGDDWPTQARAFAEAVAPLREAGKLGGVLLQFPFSFHYTPANRRYLDALCRELAPLPRLLEFRNAEWQRDPVYDHMRELGITNVVTDMPGLRGLPTPQLRTTSTAAYLRFHGRNEAQWWKGDNRSRYDYSYRPEELEPWAQGVRELMTQVAIIMVAFNNHANAQAVGNARDLQGLLGIPTPSEPPASFP